MFKFKIVYLTYFFFGYLFWHFGANMLSFRSDGWYVGHVNLYGDLLLHLAFISKFLQLNTLLVPSPIFDSIKPNYPPGADFITAMLAHLVGLKLSLHLTTFGVGLFTIHMVRKFVLTFIKNESVVFITLLLFFFNGGFGFLYFFQDFLMSGKPIFDFMAELPREYTNLQDNGIWWINSLLAYFLPQRGFLFAFPLALLSLKLLYEGVAGKDIKRVVLAAFSAGILPFFQFYSLFVIFIFCALAAPWMLLKVKQKKKLIKFWIVYGSMVASIAFPAMAAISDANAIQFIRFDPGWTSKENLISFWFKNLGLFAPVLILAFIWLIRVNRKLLFLYLPFLLIFLLSNVFVFQPWDFDNSKLLIFWYFASCIVVAYFLYSLFLKDSIFRKFFAVALISVMVFSGALDVFRTFTKVSSYRIFSSHDVEVGDAVLNLTPVNSLFVTSNNHNNPIVSIAGRTTLLGFEGWVWSHGLDYSQRSKDIRSIYAGDEGADSLISNYKINYVSISASERSSFNINDSYFKKFPVINMGEGWKIYDVSNLWANVDR